MCFVFIWEQTVTCATYSINWLVFITEIKSVYCVVQTRSLNKAVCASSLKVNMYKHSLYLWKPVCSMKSNVVYSVLYSNSMWISPAAISLHGSNSCNRWCGNLRPENDDKVSNADDLLRICILSNCIWLIMYGQFVLHYLTIYHTHIYAF